MPKKTDRNQQEIIDALRKIGCTVVSTHTQHKGFPDLVVGYRGVNYLIEVKDGQKPPSAQKLTPQQVKFFDEWRGQVTVVNSVEQAIDYITKHKQEK